MINVAGKVRNPFRFELKNSSALGSELIDYALPLAKVSHVGVIGDRASGRSRSICRIKILTAFS